MEPAAILGKSIIVSGLLVLADATGVEQFPWATVVGTGGAYGVLAWYLWYDTCKGRPKRDREHNEAIIALQTKAEETHQSHKLEVRELIVAARLERIEEQKRYETLLNEQRVRYESQLERSDADRKSERELFLSRLGQLSDKFQCRVVAQEDK